MDTTALVLALFMSLALTVHATQRLQTCPAATVGWAKKFVERRGTQFVVDGMPFYVNGFNTYWLMVFAVDESTRNKVQQVFMQASSVGLTVARTWAFNDGGWRALQKSPGVYDEQVFQALDYVISEASKHNIRLVLTLSNNWDAYGGKSQYVKWGKSAGVANLTSDDAFFTDSTLKSYFKSYVTTVLNRVNTITHVSYKDDPAIMAWELMNEPRCLSDPSGDALDGWIKEMAFHIKGVDSNHLLTTGLEGFYGPSSTARANDVNPNTYAAQVGTDFLRHHSVLGIDFASVHVYADSWVTANTVSESHIAWAEKWTTAHVEDADKVLGMPVLFGEFGVSAKDKGYNVSFRNRFYQTVYDAVLGSIREGGAGAGSLVWQIFPEGVEYMDDGYALVLSTDNSTAALVARQSSRLSLFNKLCNKSCKWKCKKRSSEVSKHRYVDDLELEL